MLKNYVSKYMEMTEEYQIKVKISEFQLNEKYANDKSKGKVLILPFTNLVKNVTSFDLVIFFLIYYININRSLIILIYSLSLKR